MNQYQYECLRHNRRRRNPVWLSEVVVGRCGGRGAAQAVLAAAGRRLRRREAAESAWQQVARPAWLVETEVEGVCGNTLVIVVSGSALCYELGRQRARLQQELCQLVPGIRSLDFVISSRRIGPPPGSLRGEGD